MKKWLLALALLLVPSAAFAQCTGVAPANTLCGNLTGSPNVPGFYSSTGAVTGTVFQNWVPEGVATNVLGNGFYLLPNPSSLYASPTGSDTNNTCTNSGTPCTLKGACTMRSALGTFLQSISGSIAINLADGTYTALDGNNALCSIAGNNGGSSGILTFLTGNVSNPQNVILSVPAGDTGIFVHDLGETEINGITITGGNNSLGISMTQFAVVDVLGIRWGSWGTSGNHYNGGVNSSLNIISETITAGIGIHINLGSANLSTAPNSISIPSPVAWGTDFISVAGTANINFNASTFTGAGVAGTTGVGARFIGTGYMLNGGTPCATFFPGNGGCAIRFGFQDDAADLQTTGEMLNSAMPAPTRAGDIVYNNGSSWWQSLAGNNSGTQCFTENSSGVPGWQTCPIYTATTWTPTITTDATVGTPAYSIQVGSYEQIGRQITARFYITLSGWTGSPTGNVAIGGLPITSNNTTNDYGDCTISFYTVTGLAASNLGLTGLITNSATTAGIYQNGTAATGKLTAAQAGTTPTLIGVCHYRS